jgi:NADH-quinone oxidoreductase subunit G
VLRGRLRRVVPRDNEAINESWLSDRDRFSCHAIYRDDRLLTPRVKHDGKWVDATWQDALTAAVGKLRQATAGGGASGLGTLVSPSATLEEAYLLQRITRHLGSDNIDYRLRQRDFRDQASDARAPLLGCSLAELDTRQGVLVVGSNLRMEVPIVAHRVRKAARKGASVAFLNTEVYEYYFKPAAYVTAAPEALAANLAAVLAAASSAAGTAIPRTLLERLKASASPIRIAPRRKRSRASPRSCCSVRSHNATRSTPSCVRWRRPRCRDRRRARLLERRRQRCRCGARGRNAASRAGRQARRALGLRRAWHARDAT